MSTPFRITASAAEFDPKVEEAYYAQRGDPILTTEEHHQLEVGAAPPIC